MSARKILLSVILIFTFLSVVAQNKCTVSGLVSDKNGEPVYCASVVLYDGNKVIAGGITNERGGFNLIFPRSAKTYRLVVEFIGYSKKEMDIAVSSSSVNVGKILIEDDVQLLGEVVVTAKTESHKSSLERTSINASANMVSSKGSAIDLLTSASSVTILNDVISIRGNSNILVLIDGIPTTVSDLSAIPAANIKSIDIITNPDASYDAGGTGGIINIISKRGGNKGFSGVAAVNYGFNHFVTGNIAFSYNRGKSSYRFNYNTKYEDDQLNTILNRTIHQNNHQTLQQMKATRYTFNNNIGFGADFRIDKRNTLNIDLKCILPRLNVNQNLTNIFIGAGGQETENRYNDVTWNRENIEAAIDCL